jgi:putative two-component system response regulator
MMILVVDGDRTHLKRYESMIKGIIDSSLAYFKSAAEALLWLENNEPDFAIVDVDLQDMHGFEFLRQLRDKQPRRKIPILITSGRDSKETRLRAFTLGACDFLVKPVDADELTLRITNLLNLQNFGREQIITSEWLADLLNRSTELVLEREREVIMRLARLAELRDPESANHIRRIAEYSRLIARGAALGSDVEETMFNAAPMHDVGKAALPDYVLLKPGVYTPLNSK